jgi:hypothetical protein
MGGEGGGGDDGLPSLTPQWMRGGGGGRGASLTTGATAGGHHNKSDTVPQLPPQLVRSGVCARVVVGLYGKWNSPVTDVHRLEFWALYALHCWHVVLSVSIATSVVWSRDSHVWCDCCTWHMYCRAVWLFSPATHLELSQCIAASEEDKCPCPVQALRRG